MTFRPSDFTPQQLASAGVVTPSAGKKEKPSYGGYRFDSKTEDSYARHLDLLLKGGHLDWWEYSPLKIRIGERCWLTLDFFVKPLNGGIEAHEVKGWLREDAAVKMKASMKLIRMFGWRLFIVRKQPISVGGWDIREMQ